MPVLGSEARAFRRMLAALIQTGEKCRLQPLQIAGAAARVNERQQLLMVEKIREALGGLKGKNRRRLLGLSFKPNTNDIREAPPLTILNEIDEG